MKYQKYKSVELGDQLRTEITIFCEVLLVKRTASLLLVRESRKCFRNVQRSPKQAESVTFFVFTVLLFAPTGALYVMMRYNRTDMRQPNALVCRPISCRKLLSYMSIISLFVVQSSIMTRGRVPTNRPCPGTPAPVSTHP